MAGNVEVSDGKSFVEIFNACADSMLTLRSVEEERAQRTLKPTVIIGLGGTGCAIGARLKRALCSYYSQLGVAAGMIQYVMIDAEPLGEQQQALVKRHFAEGQEYFYIGGLDPEGFIDANLDRPEHSDLRRWWDTDFRLEDVPLRTGAKAIRQLGRLCLYNASDTVAQAIRGAANRARELDAELVRSGNLSQPPQELGLTFYIITGSCGGTGSGMFLDVCYMVHREALDLGLSRPSVRAVILMPTLHVKTGSKVLREMGPHYQANAYAFFKEVHHFILNGREWEERHGMEADRLLAHRSGKRGRAWRPADRFYLIDNLVAGHVLAKLEDVFTLAADSLFHIIATPVGGAEEGRVTTNVDYALSGRKDGKATAFSSLGVAYVIYPAKTIARAASAGHLAEIIGGHYLREAPPGSREQEQALARAKEVFSGKDAQALNPELVAATIREKAKEFERSLPSATEIERNAAKRQEGKKLGYYGAMEQAQSTFESLVTMAETAIEQAYKELRDASLPSVDDVIRKGVTTCFGSSSVPYVREVLKGLHGLVNASAPPAAVHSDSSKSGSGRDVLYADTAQSAKNDVKRMESDYVPGFFQRKAFRHAIRTFATALESWFSATLAETARKYALDYQGKVLAKLEEAQERCDRICLELKHLLDELLAQAGEYSPDHDESYLVVTTQLVPRGGVEAAATALRADLAKRLSEDARELLSGLGNAVWAMGSHAAADRQTARQTAVENMVNWVLKIRDVGVTLSSPVNEVAIADMGEAAFRDKVLAAMLKLSDPSWELSLARAAIKESEIPSLFSLARPDGVPKSVLPSRLREEEDSHACKPIDQRRILVLQTQHAAPLHAVVGVNVLRSAYLDWIASKDRSTRPVHISREWKRGMGLSDIFPEAVTRNREAVKYFALGAFSEWLVTVKKHPAVAGIVIGWAHGYLYARGTSKYYAVQLAKADGGKLTRKGEKWLNERGGRSVALANFDDSCIDSGKMYMEAIEDCIAPTELKTLLGETEYLAYLQQQINRAKTADAENQLRVEREAIKEYMEAEEA